MCAENFGGENYPSAMMLERLRYPLPNERARVVVRSVV